MFYTLFKSNGEIIKLTYKPSLEMVLKILNCKNIETYCYNFYYKNKEYEDVEIIIDGDSLTTYKPINQLVSNALSSAIGWNNGAYMRENDSKFMMYGNIVIITKEELITV